jgi:hypothetical protein
MKKQLTLALVLLSLSGCNGTVDRETPPEQTSSANIYNWEAEGISFEVPEGLVVTKSQGQQPMLVLYKEDLTGFEGETLPGSITITLAEGTVEKQISQNSKSVEEVKIGENTYTLDTYVGDMTEKTVAHYLIQKGSEVVSIWTDPSDERVQTVLETLKLN